MPIISHYIYIYIYTGLQVVSALFFSNLLDTIGQYDDMAQYSISLFFESISQGKVAPAIIIIIIITRMGYSTIAQVHLNPPRIKVNKKLRWEVFQWLVIAGFLCGF